MKLSQLRRYATRGVIVSALVLGAVFTAAATYALLTYVPASVSEAPLAALTWIPAPSNTPRPATATPPATSTPTATYAPLAAGEMGIGSYVQVDTGGSGLNVRNAPGLNTSIEFLGFDAEVFEIRDGPREADGYTWWYVVTPVDSNRAGWAAASFLALVANP